MARRRLSSATSVLSTASLILGCLVVLSHGFTLPQNHKSPAPLSTYQHSSTALGWRRPFHLLGSKQMSMRSGNQVVNQSSYTLGSQDYEDKCDKKFRISSDRLRIEEAWRQRRVKQAAKAAQPSETTKSVKAAKHTTSANIASSTMSLVKAILGTGVLSLPYGLAAASDFPSALVPASVLLAVLGVFSGYTFQLYGRLTHDTQATNMGEVWERTKGKETSWIISASTFAFCFGVSLVYMLVIGDFLSDLAMSFGSSLPAILVQRQFWILSVTMSVLLPLCNLKSLAALAPVSVLGTMGTILTAVFMGLRCPAIFAGSPYSIASGAVGKFAAASLKAAPALAPQFSTYSNIVSPAALIIAGMSTTAYLGHFNAPEFYHGFKSKKSANATSTKSTPINEQDLSVAVDSDEESDRTTALKKFAKMTGIGFTGVTIMNILILAFGFLTFGGASQGLILNNYSTADRGAAISRLLMTVSVAGGFPLIFAGCKSAFLQLFSKGENGSDLSKKNKWIVGSLLTAVTSLALVVNDAGLVVSLIGALMGSAIIYVFPTIMFLSHTSKQIQAAGGRVSRRLRLERWASRFLATFGIVSGLIAAAVSVVNSCAPHLLR